MLRQCLSLVGALLLVPFTAIGQAEDVAYAGLARKQGLADLMIEYLQVRYPGVPVEGHVLYVSVKRQRMFHVVEGALKEEYIISTARNGLGFEPASNRTPTGLHRVVEKVGAGVPIGGILKERQYTGEHMSSDTTHEDLITSRILWLGGLEPGVNQGGSVDSQRRTIYIHGTRDEASLGVPSSHGCVRMRNADVVRLFDRVPVGTLVVILDN
jgi:lipoprotein-anchoring transpeptidase ErfK/SrfK